MDVPIFNCNELPGGISEADRMLCGLIGFEPTLPEGAERIGGQVWEEIVRTAEKEDLASLLYNRLHQRSIWPKVPESLRSRLERAHWVNGARGVIFESSLRQVLEDFSREKIVVIVLKGAFLSGNIYGDLSERMMGDIDLLVQMKSFDQAAAALRRAGYRSTLDYPAEEGATFNKAAPGFFKEGYPPVDLHWDLEMPDWGFQVDLEGIWQRAQINEIEGIPTLGLSKEDLLIYLSMHLMNHRLRSGIRSVYDFGITIDHYAQDLDWDILINRARSWRADRATTLTAVLAKELFGAKIPAPVLGSLKPSDLDPMILLSAAQLLFENEQSGAYLDANIVRLTRAAGLREKTRVILSRIFPTKTVISYQYGVSPNSIRVWLYYPRRWVYLIRTYAGPLWKQWSGDRNSQAFALAGAERFELEERVTQWASSGARDFGNE